MECRAFVAKGRWNVVTQKSGISNGYRTTNGGLIEVVEESIVSKVKRPPGANPMDDSKSLASSLTGFR